MKRLPLLNGGGASKALLVASIAASFLTFNVSQAYQLPSDEIGDGDLSYIFSSNRDHHLFTYEGDFELIDHGSSDASWFVVRPNKVLDISGNFVIQNNQPDIIFAGNGLTVSSISQNNNNNTGLSVVAVKGNNGITTSAVINFKSQGYGLVSTQKFLATDTDFEVKPDVGGSFTGVDKHEKALLVFQNQNEQAAGNKYYSIENLTNAQVAEGFYIDTTDLEFTATSNSTFKTYKDFQINLGNKDFKLENSSIDASNGAFYLTRSGTNSMKVSGSAVIKTSDFKVYDGATIDVAASSSAVFGTAKKVENAALTLGGEQFSLGEEDDKANGLFNVAGNLAFVNGEFYFQGSQEKGSLVTGIKTTTAGDIIGSAKTISLYHANLEAAGGISLANTDLTLEAASNTVAGSGGYFQHLFNGNWAALKAVDDIRLEKSTISTGSATGLYSKNGAITLDSSTTLKHETNLTGVTSAVLYAHKDIDVLGKNNEITGFFHAISETGNINIFGKNIQINSDAKIDNMYLLDAKQGSITLAAFEEEGSSSSEANLVVSKRGHGMSVNAAYASVGETTRFHGDTGVTLGELTFAFSDNGNKPEASHTDDTVTITAKKGEISLGTSVLAQTSSTDGKGYGTINIYGQSVTADNEGNLTEGNLTEVDVTMAGQLYGTTVNIGNGIGQSKVTVSGTISAIDNTSAEKGYSINLIAGSDGLSLTNAKVSYGDTQGGTTKLVSKGGNITLSGATIHDNGSAGIGSYNDETNDAGQAAGTLLIELQEASDTQAVLAEAERIISIASTTINDDIIEINAAEGKVEISGATSIVADGATDDTAVNQGLTITGSSVSLADGSHLGSVDSDGNMVGAEVDVQTSNLALDGTSYITSAGDVSIKSNNGGKLTIAMDQTNAGQEPSWIKGSNVTIGDGSGAVDLTGGLISTAGNSENESIKLNLGSGQSTISGTGIASSTGSVAISGQNSDLTLTNNGDKGPAIISGADVGLSGLNNLQITGNNQGSGENDSHIASSGNLSIKTTGKVDLGDDAWIQGGNGSTTTIKTPELTLNDGAHIGTGTQDGETNQGGALAITSDKVSLGNNSYITSSGEVSIFSQNPDTQLEINLSANGGTDGWIKGESVSVTGNAGVALSGGSISTTGDSGHDINIASGDQGITITDTELDAGDKGEVTIGTTENGSANVTISSTNPDKPISITGQSVDIGASGVVNIDNAAVTANDQENGSVNIATGTGLDASINNSNISAPIVNMGVGTGGELTVTGSEISADHVNFGGLGATDENPGKVIFDGESSLTAGSTETAGSININSGINVVIGNNSSLTSVGTSEEDSTAGLNVNGGQLTIEQGGLAQADDDINVSNGGVIEFTEPTQGAGDPGKLVAGGNLSIGDTTDTGESSNTGSILVADDTEAIIVVKQPTSSSNKPGVSVGSGGTMNVGSGSHLYVTDNETAQLPSGSGSGLYVDEAIDLEVDGGTLTADRITNLGGDKVSVTDNNSYVALDDPFDDQGNLSFDIETGASGEEGHLTLEVGELSKEELDNLHKVIAEATGRADITAVVGPIPGLDQDMTLEEWDAEIGKGSVTTVGGVDISKDSTTDSGRQQDEIGHGGGSYLIGSGEGPITVTGSTHNPADSGKVTITGSQEAAGADNFEIVRPQGSAQAGLVLEDETELTLGNSSSWGGHLSGSISALNPNDGENPGSTDPNLEVIGGQWAIDGGIDLGTGDLIIHDRFDAQGSQDAVINVAGDVNAGVLEMKGDKTGLTTGGDLSISHGAEISGGYASDESGADVLVNGQFTVAGGGLTMTGNAHVTVGDSSTITGGMIVESDASFNAQDDLTVTDGNSQFDGTVSVAGDYVNTDGETSVTGTTTIDDTAEVNDLVVGNATGEAPNGHFTAGATTVHGSFMGHDNSASTINGKFDVAGESSVGNSGSLTVNGEANFNDDLHIGESADFAAGDTTVGGNFTADADSTSTITGKFEVAGESSVGNGGSLTVNGEANFSNDLHIGESADFAAGDTTVGGNFTADADSTSTITGKFEVAGESSVGNSGSLTVNGEASFNDDLHIGENGSLIAGGTDGAPFNVSGQTTLDTNASATVNGEASLQQGLNLGNNAVFNNTASDKGTTVNGFIVMDEGSKVHGGQSFTLGAGTSIGTDGNGVLNGLISATDTIDFSNVADTGITFSGKNAGTDAHHINAGMGSVTYRDGASHVFSKDADDKEGGIVTGTVNIAMGGSLTMDASMKGSSEQAYFYMNDKLQVNDNSRVIVGDVGDIDTSAPGVYFGTGSVFGFTTEGMESGDALLSQGSIFLGDMESVTIDWTLGTEATLSVNFELLDQAGADNISDYVSSLFASNNVLQSFVYTEDENGGQLGMQLLSSDNFGTSSDFSEVVDAVINGSDENGNLKKDLIEGVFDKQAGFMTQDGDGNWVVNELGNQRLQDVLSLPIAAGAFNVAYDAMSEMNQTMANRMAEPISAHSVSVWADVIATYNSAEELFGHSGYSADIYAAVMGADVGITEDWIAGLAFTIGQADANGEGDTMGIQNDADFYGLSLYTAKNVGQLRFSGDLGYLKLKNDISTDVNYDGKGDTDVITVGARMDMTVHQGEQFDVTPHFGIRYANFNIDTINATATNDINVVEVPLGVTVKGKTQVGGWKVAPMVDVSVVPQFGDKKAKIWNAGVAYEQDVLDSALVKTSVGVSAQKGNFTFGLNYRLGAGNDERQNHSFNANIRYQF